MVGMGACPYIFKADDPAVKFGKRVVGEVCRSDRGSPKYNGFCAGHARQAGLITPEQTAEATQKRLENIKKTREKINENVKNAVNNASEGSPINKTVLEAMNLNDPCDLASEYAIFKTLNQNPSYENYDEKMAFARWLRTPQHLRTPQIIEDAAKILGVSAYVLFAWKTAPDVVRFINMETENRALCMFPFAMYKLGCGIDRGDTTSIKLYREWYEEKMASLKKTEKTLNLSPELEREAAEYRAATGITNRGKSLASERNMVIDNHFAGDELNEPNEQ